MKESKTHPGIRFFASWRSLKVNLEADKELSLPLTISVADVVSIAWRDSIGLTETDQIDLAACWICALLSSNKQPHVTVWKRRIEGYGFYLIRSMRYHNLHGRR